jgi:hypothetical protein
VRTLAPTETLSLNAADFHELVAQQPEIWVEVQREAQLRAARNEQLDVDRKARALLLYVPGACELLRRSGSRHGRGSARTCDAARRLGAASRVVTA